MAALERTPAAMIAAFMLFFIVVVSFGIMGPHRRWGLFAIRLRRITPC
jgi:hypothetical protein